MNEDRESIAPRPSVSPLPQAGEGPGVRVLSPQEGDGQGGDMPSHPPIEVRPEEWRIVCVLLQKHLPGCEVWAFGSRARGKAKPFSDLDLAIVTDQPLGLDVLAALAEDFSESDLPWKVDLVVWATTGERFRDIIRREKVVVQQARPILRHEHRNEQA